MITRAIFLTALCISIGQLGAQPADGDYHFVDLRLRSGGPATAMLGSMNVRANAASYAARRTQGPSGAQTITGTATVTGFDANASTVAGLATDDSNVRLRVGQGSAVLVGAGTSGDHELLLALRKSTGTPVLRGRYSGAYLRFTNGVAARAETCQVVFDVSGTSISSMTVVNHAANADDVNRVATSVVVPTPTAVEQSADGSGTLHFGSGGPIEGNLGMAASSDGTLLFATNTEGTTRDLLIMVRDVGDATESSLTGTYWMAELGGESPYAEQTDGLQLSSADGAFFSFGTGVASIAERVRTANQDVELSTAVRYRLGSGPDRMLGRTVTSGLRNFAISDDLGVFVSSWTGRAGDLTLEHGLAVGVRAPVLRVAALNAGSSAPVTAAVAPGTLVSVYGPNLASATTRAEAFPLPTSLGGTTVTVNGVAAGLLVVSAGQVNLQIPYETTPGIATVEVRGSGPTTTFNVPVAPQSPGVFSVNQAGTGAAIATHGDYQLVTGQNPARPNETVLVFLTGLGAVTPGVASGAAAEGALRRVADPGLQVLFNGIAGRVDFAGLSPGFAGLYQINAVVPDTDAVEGSVALGVRTSTAYSDLTDISISR